jgi:3,4-dihydroxy 2-butanone 4-phosphate synthase / GTP cyclohydrolase II
MKSDKQFTDVGAAIEELRAGRMIVVIHDDDREDEGDLMMAAAKVTPEAINFMAKHGRGLVCLAMTGERLDKLDLCQMVSRNTASLGTAFTVSIDAAGFGVTSGISAFDRSRTIRVAIDSSTKPHHLARPGHVFPLRARSGGVLERPGHTEAAVDLAHLAGLHPSGVICEIMNDDGTMSRSRDLARICSKHEQKMITDEDMVTYRLGC